ncbi:substrate binding domain-containing protein [Burkholderia sp. WSM2232]|uniref:substrate binding domain-containing protein n=1 Tax=Burkholderia sp. WSM2232 TaxID=944436 RepID=UPI001E362B24
MPNLLEEQLDIGIVITRTLPDSAYVSQNIGTSHCVLAASLKYLAAHPAPACPEDLIDDQCVLPATVGYAPDEWHLQSAAGEAIFRPAGPHLSVNDMGSMSQALRDGAGIGILAGFSAIDDLRSGALVRVLPGYHTQVRNVYVVYPSRQLVDAKIKRFVVMLKTHVGDHLDAYTRELDLAPATIAPPDR